MRTRARGPEHLIVEIKQLLICMENQLFGHKTTVFQQGVFQESRVHKNQNIYKYKALSPVHLKQLKHLNYTSDFTVTPNWKWDSRLRMCSPLGLDIPFPCPLQQHLIKFRVDLFWIALKDKTKTNMAGKSKNLPCKIANSLLLGAFRLDNHLLTKCR